MSNRPKHKRRTAKKNGETSYVPTSADEFPFGAPPSSKKHTPSASAPPEDPSKKEEVVRPNKRKPRVRSSDDNSLKRHKVVADSTEVTAFESRKGKRKVEKTGIIDDLSVKPSKSTKALPASKTTEFKDASSRKRLANTPVFADRFSAKRPKTGSWNIDDDSVMNDAPLDTATGSATELKASDKTATPTSSIKRDVPISLEALAREEEAAQAAEAGLPSLAKSAGKCFATSSFEPN